MTEQRKPEPGLEPTQIKLEKRDPKDPFCFPCCGGLRPAHTSRCRDN